MNKDILFFVLKKYNELLAFLRKAKIRKQVKLRRKYRLFLIKNLYSISRLRSYRFKNLRKKKYRNLLLKSFFLVTAIAKIKCLLPNKKTKRFLAQNRVLNNNNVSLIKKSLSYQILRLKAKRRKVKIKMRKLIIISNKKNMDFFKKKKSLKKKQSLEFNITKRFRRSCYARTIIFKTSKNNFFAIYKRSKKKSSFFSAGLYIKHGPKRATPYAAMLVSRRLGRKI